MRQAGEPENIGQVGTALLMYSKSMSPLQRAIKTLGILSLALAAPGLVHAQSGFSPQAQEFVPLGNLPGDQIRPAVAFTNAGGWIVWQDNITDGSGFGISAQRLDSSLSATFNPFRVNQQGSNDQQNAKISLLGNGGAAIIWQGGATSYQHVYARFIATNGTFLTGEFQVNTATNFQVNPTITTLANGNLVALWSSFNQASAGSLQDVYGQLLSPNGQKIGGEFAVNTFQVNNQRTPAIAALPAGGFVVTWVSELQRATNGVDIFARVFNANAAPVTSEFLVNSGTNVCANPAVAASKDGTFMITWGEKDTAVLNNDWDIYARRFTAGGSGGTTFRVNTQRFGPQFLPQIAAVRSGYQIVWTSVGQDGSREGVYSQFVAADGSPLSSLSGNGTVLWELPVNTTTLNSQIYPAIAADGSGRSMVVWSSYTGGLNSMDLYAQRYSSAQQSLPAPGAPFVAAVSGDRLTVTWPNVAGFQVANYDLYIDGSAVPTVVSNNYFSVAGLAPSSTHSFQLDYVLVGGQHSPLSATTSGTTWAADVNGDGLPDDWQALYWGSNSSHWPSAGTLLAAKGPTAETVFLWGANPLLPATWLTTAIQETTQGTFLSWNTQPGGVYQVLTSKDLNNWTNLGSSRFAAGTNDSVFVGLSAGGNFYKINRIRY